MDAPGRWNGMVLRIDITCGKSYSMKETHCILLKLQSLLALGHEVRFFDVAWVAQPKSFCITIGSKEDIRQHVILVLYVTKFHKF